MAFVVRELLATPQLGLTLLTSGVGLDREIRWAHVTELVDPTPFLEGGEVVLTLGIGLATLPLEEYPAYIAGSCTPRWRLWGSAPGSICRRCRRRS